MLHLEGNWKKIESVRRRKPLLIGGHKYNPIYFDINYVAMMVILNMRGLPNQNEMGQQ